MRGNRHPNGYDNRKPEFEELDELEMLSKKYFVGFTLSSLK